MSDLSKVKLNSVLYDIKDATARTGLDNKVDKVTGKGLSTNDYTSAEKTKLSGIAEGAEVNQNTFSSIVVGDTTISADSKTDSFSLIAGTNVTLVPDASDDSIVISATNTDTKVKSVVSSNNANYPIHLNNGTGAVTSNTLINSNVYVNPSTGNLGITKINGVTVGSDPKFTDTTYESKAAASSGTDVSLVTTGEKYTWNAKQDSISDLETIRSNAALGATAIQSSAKGAVGGVAELDSTGKVPSSQLPAYVDDVIEGYYHNGKFYEDSTYTKEITGETGKIYVDKLTEKTYRWSGSAFVEISASLALGETSSTAYRGDNGKTAYDHSQLTSGNPHNVGLSDLGVAATAAELNVLDGITATTTELNYVDGVTSGIQAQLDNKIANPSPKSSGQILSYNGTNWVASDPESGLPTATTAGTAAIYNGTEWIAQTGYGYSADSVIFSKINATTTNLNTEEEPQYGYNDTAIPLVDGVTYTVVIDGVTYTSTAVNWSNIIFIGNLSMDPEEGDPYVAATDGDTVNAFYVLTDTAPTSHTVSVSGTIVTKISDTLLPLYGVHAAGNNNSVVQDIPEAYKGTEEGEELKNNIGDVIGSAVFGYGNTVADTRSFVAGVNNKATDFGTFIIGEDNETGNLSYGADRVYIYGSGNTVKDNYGLSIGFSNTVKGEYCAAIGRNLTQSREKYVFGTSNYNYTNSSDTAPYIAVGDNSGGNAVEISSSGDIWFKGDAYVGSTSGDHQDSGKKKLATTDVVTTSAAGLMSAADKTKLDNIPEGGGSYTLPVATSSTLGGIKSGTDITVDASGNVSVNDDSHNHVISNIDSLQNVLDGKASTDPVSWENNGLMSAEDKEKLDGIATGATNVTESTVSGWGFTKNAGTITKVTASNGLTSSTTSGETSIGLSSESIASLAKADSAIPNPSTKSSGQVLSYNGTNWVASNPESGLPTATIAGTAAIYDGTNWTAQTGYGYIPAASTLLYTISGNSSFLEDFQTYGYTASSLSLTEGTTYVTVLDGITYADVAISFEGQGIIAGNLERAEDPSITTGDPYFLYSVGGQTYILVFDTAATSHTGSIGSSTGIVKIDSKYLPDIPPIEEGTGTESLMQTVSNETYKNEVSGQWSSAFGILHNNAGTASMAVGASNTIDDAVSYGFATGCRNEISGSESTAIGYENEISGSYSFASGYQNNVEGSYSHALGIGLSIPSDATQIVVGTNNYEDNSNIFIVGGGTAAAKSNIATFGAVTNDGISGDAWIKGDVYVGSTSGTHKDAGSRKLIVEPASKSANQVLTYDGTNWIASTPSSGGTWGSITGTLSDQTDLNTALGEKESTSNKVTSLSSSSTDTQYPSAKAVYDSLGAKVYSSSVTPSSDMKVGDLWYNEFELHPEWPLHFIATVANTTVNITASTSEAPALTMEYSLNNSTWSTYTVGTNITLTNIGDMVFFRGTNERMAASGGSPYNRFITSQNVYCGGNIMSILDSTMAQTSVPAYGFSYLFYSSKILTAPYMPATTVGNNGYYQMFGYCSQLIVGPPSLPIQSIGSNACNNMFSYCTSLKFAPKLPCTSLNISCYITMFNNCTSLEVPPALPATTLNTYSYYSMFSGCTSLRKVPKLPAAALLANSYQAMFSGCTSLKVYNASASGHTKLWRIPSANPATGTTTQANMFLNTVGDYSSTASVDLSSNIAFYTEYEPV